MLPACRVRHPAGYKAFSAECQKEHPKWVRSPKPNWTILHNKYPPTPRVGLVRPRIATRHPSPSSHSSFCEEVFSLRVRETNEVNRTNILAPGLSCLYSIASRSRLHPRAFGDWPKWEVVSSYSSATAPDSHGISCADPLFQARKELSR